MFKFSESSLEKLHTCHSDIVKIMLASIRTSMIDFGINEGHRTAEKQYEYFMSGASRCDGIKTKSKHQGDPSMAVDIYAFYNGSRHWDDAHLAYLGGHIIATSKMLYAAGTIEHKIRWGANWDSDGILIYDQTLKDLPHYELIK